MTERAPETEEMATRLESRMERFREAARVKKVDAVVVSSMSNILYLANFRASAGILVVGIADESLKLLVDFRYQDAARRLIDSQVAPRGLELVDVPGSYEEALAGVLHRIPATGIGVESDHMTVRQWQWLDSHTRADLIPLTGLVEGLRIIKDQGELTTLRRAGKLLSDLVPGVFSLVDRKRREVEVAQEIDRLVIQAGFDRVAFETIVASGPNSALPHAHPTGRELRDGDLVILDFGGVLDGYCVDISRTVSVGEVSAECRRLYFAVDEAQLAALDSVSSGVKAEEVDGVARTVLDRHGLGDAFGHSTGHGLGLDVHELPRVGRARAGVKPVTLECGMVFTIEPGVYVPGLGGVRIEDDVVVTEAGAEILTPGERGLVVV